LILGILFLAWGVNQIVNDWLGLAEDRVNAPRRPMVTGELPPGPALAFSGVGIAASLAAAYWLNPVSMLPLAAGVALYVFYDRAKAWSLTGTLVFGIMIAMAPVFGFLAAGPAPEPLFTSNRAVAIFLTILANAVMTYYTYFKDRAGDRAAGVGTFVARHTLWTARRVGLAAAFATAAACALSVAMGWLPAADILFHQEFLLAGAIAAFLQARTGWAYFRHPAGPRTYRNLALNFQACAASHCALIAVFNGPLALGLLAASLAGIDFLFSLHPDARA
jgi:geranylgeranylglycerol-phosphate geranylgeranyltransferase